VTVSVSGFGDTGPYRDRPGSELLYQALSGSMAATGRQDREPLAGAGRRGEYAAGVFAYVGTLAALFARENDGIGQHVDTSVFESLAAMGQCFTTLFEYNGYVFRRDEPLFYPYACYPTADGYISFCLTRVANWPSGLNVGPVSTRAVNPYTSGTRTQPSRTTKNSAASSSTPAATTRADVSLTGSGNENNRRTRDTWRTLPSKSRLVYSGFGAWHARWQRRTRHGAACLAP
jgi:formyl-CoA transferase